MYYEFIQYNWRMILVECLSVNTINRLYCVSSRELLHKAAWGGGDKDQAILYDHYKYD